MIPVKLERDEARALQQYFFVFLERVCISRETNATTDNEKMLQHLFKEQFHQVQQLFYKKLLNRGNKMKFPFTDSQAIVLYNLLFHFPIHHDQIYMIQLRNNFCELLRKPVMDLIKLEEIKMKQAVETA